MANAIICERRFCSSGQASSLTASATNERRLEAPASDAPHTDPVRSNAGGKAVLPGLPVRDTFGIRCPETMGVNTSSAAAGEGACGVSEEAVPAFGPLAAV